jgi:hypothetical protein
LAAVDAEADEEEEEAFGSADSSLTFNSELIHGALAYVDGQAHGVTLAYQKNPK